MSEEIKCDICTAPMEIEKKVNSHTKTGNKVRKRRFGCTVCDFKKTIYADGGLDIDYYDSIEEETKKKELGSRKNEYLE